MSVSIFYYIAKYRHFNISLKLKAFGKHFYVFYDEVANVLASTEKKSSCSSLQENILIMKIAYKREHR